MVTLTRGIAMYLIGPFPRPQFSRGPWPQVLPLRGPSSSSRGAISPSNPSSGTAERRAEPTHRAARHDSRQSIETTRAPLSTRKSTRHRPTRNQETEQPTRSPAAHRTEPVARPGRLPTRRNGPPRWPRATRADASRPHDTPSGAGHRQPHPNAGTRSVPKSAQPRHDVHRTTVRPSCREASADERTGARTQLENRIRDQDRDHAGRAGEQLEQRPPTIRPAPQTTRTTSSGQTSTTRGTAPEGARNTHDKPPPKRTSSRTFVRRKVDRNRRNSDRTTANAEDPNDRDQARSEHACTTGNHHPGSAPSGTRSTHDEP